MSSPITWDNTGERLYETGVDQVVLYPLNSSGVYTPGVPWNGVTAITDSPSGAEPTDLYADNIKYLSLMSAETMKLTLEAYTYPDEFEACDGSQEIVAGAIVMQQKRSMFGLCYRTKIGNDVDGEDHGYKLHLVYGCMASPSQRNHQTINDTPEAITFSWEISTTPVSVTGFKPTAMVVIDSTTANSSKLEELEEILYGSVSADARLPLPDEVKSKLTVSQGP